MLIRYDFDATGYQPIKGKEPFALLDRHPDGIHVGLQAPDSPLNRAGVWNAGTRRLVWEPNETVALCWLTGGTEAALIRYAYEHEPDLHTGKVVIASPLQSEHSWSLERWSWPDRERKRYIRIASRTGWFDNVAASPNGDVVAALWMEQDCAGVELIQLDRYGDRQLVGRSLEVDTNWVTGPVFSPDGRVLLLFCGRGDSWWAPGSYDEDTPSPGGTFDFGQVVIYDLESQARSARNIPVRVPQGWLPRKPWSHRDFLLDEGRFVNGREIEIQLPTDEVIAVPLGGD